MTEQIPDAMALVLVVGFGLIVGSFLNVCIYRLPRRESLVLPASHCTACGRSLRWFENVPVLSYLILRGRCRTCSVRISPVYPAIEMAAAVVAVIWYEQFGLSVLFVSRLVFAFALLVLFVIDLRQRILPNVITVPGVVVGFAFSLLGPSDLPGWRDSLIGLVAGGGVLYLLAESWWLVRHEEAMGFGDIKMLAMIGAFLGWQLMILTLVFASLVGAVVGLVMIAAGTGNRKSQLPFGTFLALAALLACVVGQPVVNWYIDRLWR
jgi:leader peptidase (prepilin peptidase)/N-methyltransferase